MHLGDFAVGATVRHWFDTFDLGGSPVTIGSLAAYVLKNGGATHLTTGVTTSTDFDGTGLHLISVDLATYTAGEHAIVVTGSVNGVSILRAVARFSVGRLTVPTAIQNADALLKRDWTLVTGEAARSVLNALRWLRNKWSISGTTLTVTTEDDATPAWTATVARNANDPVDSVDPS